VRYQVSNLLKKEKGFTLIEIVLVLAIAGLLLVIVFLAVSGAQKSRRDTQRKNDNARLLAQVESCASNNSGDYATCNTAAMTGTYSPNNFNDPTTGSPYGVTVVFTAPTLACSAANAGTAQVGIVGRQVTSRMCLEQGQQDLKNN
jgi:prepilin-type N-terminal cleavage/methylation domain-containing protein